MFEDQNPDPDVYRPISEAVLNPSRILPTEWTIPAMKLINDFMLKALSIKLAICGDASAIIRWGNSVEMDAGGSPLIFYFFSIVFELLISRWMRHAWLPCTLDGVVKSQQIIAYMERDMINTKHKKEIKQEASVSDQMKFVRKRNKQRNPNKRNQTSESLSNRVTIECIWLLFWTQCSGLELNIDFELSTLMVISEKLSLLFCAKESHGPRLTFPAKKKKKKKKKNPTEMKCWIDIVF